MRSACELHIRPTILTLWVLYTERDRGGHVKDGVNPDDCFVESILLMKISTMPDSNVFKMSTHTCVMSATIANSNLSPYFANVSRRCWPARAMLRTVPRTE